MGLPITSYRSFPGTIFKKTCRRIGVPFEYKRFADPLKGTRALDAHLTGNRAVGIQSNIYWLSYIPEQFRFQFNAHNLVVYGKNADGSFNVSDPVLEGVSVCPAQAMTKARFAKGMLAPKGLIYFPKPNGGVKTLSELPMEKAVRTAIRETVNRMLYSPIPWAGVRGIRFLARRLTKLESVVPNLDDQKLEVANIVRMQEEIGTGGAGFRFLYAAFLQEAGELLDDEDLRESAVAMTNAGNLWRDFATTAAKFCKGRSEQPFREMSDQLLKIASAEEKIFSNLRRNYL